MIFNDLPVGASVFIDANSLCWHNARPSVMLSILGIPHFRGLSKMHEPISLEQRVALLEDEVAILKRQVAASHATQNSWLDDMTGSMRDFPEFKEVLRLGAEWRRAQQPDDEP